ncbi:APC family permease [Bacillus gobiensis]|uniref:APC family permease n=1 Tax=Bacillus gobiensis TaxID=1441095 RepID=UPI003D20EF42
MEKKERELKKVLSRFDVLFMAIGAMLGWGWVVLSGNWVTSAGSFGSMTAFLIGGLLVIFVGLTYSELTSAMPEVGGEHVFVDRALGKKASFIASWAITFGYASVVAFEAVALPTVVEYLLPNYQAGYLWTLAGWDVYATWALIGMIGAVILTVINYIGLKPAALFQTVLTIVIVLIGVMLIFGSFTGGDGANLEPFFVGGTSGIMAVLIMVPFMFVGFDVIPQTAEETNLPHKEIGKILIVSVICAVIFYLSAVFAVSMALDDETLRTSALPTADAMAVLFGSDIFANILILGGIAGIITSWNAFVIGGSRVLYAMAESGMLPSWFGKLHPKYKTPSNAILFLGILAVFAPLLGRPALVWIVDAGGLGVVVAYFMVVLSFIVLRKKEPDMARPFRAGKGPAVGWIALVLSFGFIVMYMPGMPAALVWPYEWLILAGWTLIGVYFFVRMSKGRYEAREKAVKEGGVKTPVRHIDG